MPPVKRRAKGAKAPPNRWTRGEIDVLLQCLGSDEFLSKHAKTLQARHFPPFSLRDACVKENEYHGVCVALSQEILNQAGEHNNLNLRPFASIASKILDMTAKAKASNPGLESQALFDAFDVDAFMASSGPLGPEPPPAADPAAASCRSLGSAEGGEAAKEPEAAKEDEEYDDTYVAPVRDPRNITFQTRILNPHLVCTLCMGYFNDACTIIECLHTFCRACIMRHFRESQVCPTCDSNLGTNPRDLVRTDRTLQSIVDKVFPQFAAQASTAAAAAAAASSAAAKRSASPPASSISPRPGKAARPGGARAASPAAGAAAAEEVQEEISFSLQEEVDESAATNVRLEKPYLRTSARLTVAHLKKYLAKKMKTSSEVAADLQIMCRGVALPLEISLDAIVRTHWQQATEDLVLTYRVLSSAEGAAASSSGGGGGAAAAEATESKAEAPVEPEEPAGQPAGGGGGGNGGGGGGGDDALASR